MATQVIDAKGMRCPGPTLRLSNRAYKMPPGDILEVVADCPTFETDVKAWAVRMNKTLLWIRDEGNGVKRCQIRV